MKIFLLLILVVKSLDCTRHGRVVMTPNGPVRGLHAESGDYTMYLGIPYGVVDDPFGDPTPHPGFSTVFEAIYDPVICPQYYGTFNGAINCLNLNIYVPDNNNSDEKLPVLFYIPGGAFVQGNGNRDNFGPDFLIKHDIIIVTINYRVGIYGFLCIDIPGYNNQGLKDQILALEWMKDNIESFGGDANKITVSGQSAGAMSLDLLLLVKEPLFQRVIIQSGVVLSPWVIAERNNSIPINVARELGFETNDVQEALDYLKTISASDVTTIANYLDIYNYNFHPLTKPCVENESATAVLTDNPVNLKPKVKDIDIMIGHAFREAAFRYPGADKTYYENYKFDIELLREFDNVLDEKEIRHFYIKDESPHVGLRHQILDFASDFSFAHPTERTVDRFLENGARNVYKYLFTYQGERNRNGGRLNMTSDGALHGDDLGYLWKSSALSEELSETDQKMIDVMTEMWTNFVKYGNPTPSGPTDLLPVKWLPAVRDERPYLLIDEPLSLEHRLFNERMIFWDMYYKLHSDQIKFIKK